MPAFPQELFDLIVSLAPDDPTTLKAVALSAPILYTCAQRQLYHCFRPDRWSVEVPHLPYAEPRYLNIVAFLETIIHNPTLALYVHQLFCPPRLFTGASVNWAELLTKALPLMPNLILLSIRTGEGSYRNILAALLQSKFTLEDFRWKWDDPNPDSFNIQLISTFLSQQTQLRSLTLTMSPVSISEGTCPNITHLSTTCDNLLAILPGRPIDTLDCAYLDPEDPTLEFLDLDSPIAHGLRNIRRLSLGVSTMWAKNMLRLFPNLEVLQTQIGRNPRDYHLITSYFPQLTIIHFTQSTSFSEQGMMSTWLFRNLPNLQSVIWGRVQYDCWCPFSKPISLTSEQVHERTKLLCVI